MENNLLLFTCKAIAKVVFTWQIGKVAIGYCYARFYANDD